MPCWCGIRKSPNYELTASLPFQPLPAPSLLPGGFPQQQTLPQDRLPSVHPEQRLCRQAALSPAVSCQTQACSGALNHSPKGGHDAGRASAARNLLGKCRTQHARHSRVFPPPEAPLGVSMSPTVSMQVESLGEVWIFNTFVRYKKPGSLCLFYSMFPALPLDCFVLPSCAISLPSDECFVAPVLP